MPQFNNYHLNLNYLNSGIASLRWPLKNENQLLKHLKCKVPFLLLLLLPFFANSQNLVPNPSFEDFVNCPQSTGELHQQVVDWISWSLTPDYFQVCNNDGLGTAGVPNNAIGSQNPISGDAYASLLSYNHIFDNEREYMACSLTASLEIGENYYIMFYASFYDGGSYAYTRCATNKMGVKLFKDPPLYTPQVSDNPYTPENTADIEYNEMFLESDSWVLVDGWIQPDQEFNWMAIGNFYDDDHTDTLKLGDPDKCLAIYYIENVCIAKNASDCDYLKQPQDINSVEDGNFSTIQVFPNPSIGMFQVSLSSIPKEVEVYNAIGQSIFISNQLSTNLVIDGTQWAMGLYILVVKGEGGYHQSFKLIKQ